MLTIDARYAPELVKWIKERGGICGWRSADLSDPSAQTFTPALQANGAPTISPGWKWAAAPFETVTDPAQVTLITWREVDRFRIATRMGASGLKVKLTDASTDKLLSRMDKARDKFGHEPAYEFDYESRQAVIVVPAKTISLAEWMQAQEVKP